jgi:serine protease Do
MKRYLLSVTAIAAISLLIGNSAIAQDKDEKGTKEKSKNKINQYDEIIIRKKTDKDDKVTVEVKDGEVFVNGKPIEDFENENLSVRKRRPATITYNQSSPFRTEGWNYSGDLNLNNNLGIAGSPRAFLGISTGETEGGAKVLEVTAKSAAEKAGLKKGDIITKIDDVKVSDQDDIAKEIRKRKPEEKILITLTRDGKEQKISATLGKISGSVSAFNVAPSFRGFDNFNFNGGDVNVYGIGRPRLGIRAQDTEDGKGVKVLDVSEESAAEKAGIKIDDIITEFDGKTINSADELSEAAKDSREKPSVKVILNRAGKSQTVEIKTPRKLKTTNL